MKCLTKNKGEHKAVIYELEPILLSSLISTSGTKYCDQPLGRKYIEISPQVTNGGSLKLLFNVTSGRIFKWLKDFWNIKNGYFCDTICVAISCQSPIMGYFINRCMQYS